MGAVLTSQREFLPISTLHKLVFCTAIVILGVVQNLILSVGVIHRGLQQRLLPRLRSNGELRINVVQT